MPTRALIFTVSTPAGHDSARRGARRAACATAAPPSRSSTACEAGRICRAGDRRRDVVAGEGGRRPRSSTPATASATGLAPVRRAGSRVLEQTLGGRLEAFLRAHPADVVVSTHPLTTELLGRMRASRHARDAGRQRDHGPRGAALQGASRDRPAPHRASRVRRRGARDRRADDADRGRPRPHRPAPAEPARPQRGPRGARAAGARVARRRLRRRPRRRRPRRRDRDRAALHRRHDRRAHRRQRAGARAPAGGLRRATSASRSGASPTTWSRCSPRPTCSSTRPPGPIVLDALMCDCRVISYGWPRGHVRINNGAYEELGDGGGRARPARELAHALVAALNAPPTDVSIPEPARRPPTSCSPLPRTSRHPRADGARGWRAELSWTSMDSVAILARGHWPAERVRAHWREEHYEPPERHAEAADAAIEALRERGSPSHDGLAARLVAHAEQGDELVLELQPVRWALRLVARRRVALGGGAGRHARGRRTLARGPARAVAVLVAGALGARCRRRRRHRREPRSHAARASCGRSGRSSPASLTVEALVRLPHQLVMVVGLAWLPDGAEIEMDDEHDAHAWWPADVADWPDEADEPLRRMATMLAAGGMTRAADLPPPEARVVHALGDLHGAARRLARAGPARAGGGLRDGARPRLDRDVARLHRRRAPARHRPATRRRRRGARRDRPVHRLVRVRRARAAGAASRIRRPPPPERHAAGGRPGRRRRCRTSRVRASDELGRRGAVGEQARAGRRG